MNRREILRLTLVAPIAAIFKPKFIPDPMSHHYTHYALGFKVSKELIEDDLYGFQDMMAKAVREGAIFHSQYANHPRPLV